MAREARKGVTVVLLLYAFLDVCVPGFCPYSIPVPPEAHRTVQSAQTHLPVPFNDRDDESCFCCCGHVIPVVRSILTADLLIQIIRLESVDPVPSLSLSPPHLPPRL